MEKTKYIFVKTSSLLFIISIAIAGFLTALSGLGGLLLNIPLVLIPLNLNIILTIFVLLITLILIKILNIFPENSNQFLVFYLQNLIYLIIFLIPLLRKFIEEILL